MVAENNLLGLQHCGRTGEHDTFQSARKFLLTLTFAETVTVDVCYSLHKYLAECEGHKRTAREIGVHSGIGLFHFRILLGFDALAFKQFAILGKEFGDTVEGGFCKSLLSFRNISPRERAFFGVPKIAFWRTHHRVGVVGGVQNCKTGCLTTNAHEARPSKCLGVAAHNKLRLVAESGLYKCHTHIEGVAVSTVGVGHIADFERNGVGKLKWLSCLDRFYEDTCGAAVAHVEDKVYVDALVVGVEGEFGECLRLAQHL